MCGVETGNCFTAAGECIPLLRNLIMECSEDRGIECKGVCFNYVDGEVVLSVYQNLPGIKRELAGTTFRKTFSKGDWGEINNYLIGVFAKAEGVFVDEKVEEEETAPVDADQHHIPVPTSISAKNTELPKMNAVPTMTEDDKEEIEEGENGEK